MKEILKKIKEAFKIDLNWMVPLVFIASFLISLIMFVYNLGSISENIFVIAIVFVNLCLIIAIFIVMRNILKDNRSEVEKIDEISMFFKIMIPGFLSGLAAIFFVILLKWYWILLICIGITEIWFFLIDKKKPKKKENKLVFTLNRKLVGFCYSFIVLGIFGLLKKVYDLAARHWEVVLKWVGYIGAGVITIVLVVLLAYLYIKLNSLKYDNLKTKE